MAVRLHTTHTTSPTLGAASPLSPSNSRAVELAVTKSERPEDSRPPAAEIAHECVKTTFRTVGSHYDDEPSCDQKSGITVHQPFHTCNGAERCFSELPPVRWAGIPRSRALA